MYSHWKGYNIVHTCIYIETKDTIIIYIKYFVQRILIDQSIIAYIYVYICIYMYIYLYICIYIYIFIYIYIYINIYIYNGHIF